MKIAAVTAGYADSYPRSLSNKGVWDHYVQKKKARGDYENEALGYDIKK